MSQSLTPTKETQMFHIQDKILDLMKINQHLGYSKEANIDDAMCVFHAPYISIYGYGKLDMINQIIRYTAEKLYTHTEG